MLTMIRFACPMCGTDLSAPDEQEGGVISCPSCWGNVRVPGAASVDPIPSEVVTGGHEASGERIRFRCPKCGVDLSALGNLAGSFGKCNRCGERVQVPNPHPDPNPGPVPKRPQLVPCYVCNGNVAVGAAACPHCGTPQGNLIRFSCSKCGKSFSVPPNLAGWEGKCEGCGEPVRVPGKKTAPESQTLKD